MAKKSTKTKARRTAKAVGSGPWLGSEFVVQEKYNSGEIKYGWTDDPDISPSKTLRSAKTKLRNDFKVCMGMTNYTHRIVERLGRKQRVAFKPNTPDSATEGRSPEVAL